MKIRSKGESYATGRNFGIVFIYRRPGNVSIRHACNGERPAAFCGRKDAAADEFSDAEQADGNPGRNPRHGSDSELFCDDSYGGRLCQCRDAESVAGGRRHYGCKHRYDDHRVAGIPERVRQFFEPRILCAPAAGNRRICHFICKIRQKETDR